MPQPLHPLDAPIVEASTARQRREARAKRAHLDSLTAPKRTFVPIMLCGLALGMILATACALLASSAGEGAWSVEGGTATNGIVQIGSGPQ